MLALSRKEIRVFISKEASFIWNILRDKINDFRTYKTLKGLQDPLQRLLFYIDATLHIKGILYQHRLLLFNIEQ